MRCGGRVVAAPALCADVASPRLPAASHRRYDYCFTHFGGYSATSFLCVCGAPDCRGTLDANPQRGLNRGRRIEVLWDDGVFYAATVASFTATTSKFRLVRVCRGVGASACAAY